MTEEKEKTYRIEQRKRKIGATGQLFEEQYLIIEANNPAEACNIAENELRDWGDGNNYRSFGGCFSEHGEFYINDQSARFLPTKDTTMENILDNINSWITDSELHTTLKG